MAVLHALALARAGFPTTLAAAHEAHVADLAALLAVPAPEEGLIDVNAVGALPASPTPSPYVVIDGGTAGTQQEITPSEHYLVTRPCYLALMRALDRRPQGIVLLVEPERSLTRADIEDVLGLPVLATMPVHPATARLIDAGLLATQPPRRLPLVWAH